ncbi:MAG TPA: DUF1385 domain-containing protein, partial [Clostridia bacterium]|nr:DUF1385 domain-containing protein [Clostridia bacterium]
AALDSVFGFAPLGTPEPARRGGRPVMLVGPPAVGKTVTVAKLAAASDKLWARIIRAPGLGLQYLTTREPEQDMIEVAIAAFYLAMNKGKSDKLMPENDAEAEPAQSETKEPDNT